MRAMKIPFFASADDIIKLAKKKYGKHKKFTFVEWPDGFPFGSIRLLVSDETCREERSEFPDNSIRLIINNTVGDEEDFK